MASLCTCSSGRKSPVLYPQLGEVLKDPFPAPFLLQDQVPLLISQERPLCLVEFSGQ